jgi:hypothetical protein
MCAGYGLASLRITLQGVCELAIKIHSANFNFDMNRREAYYERQKKNDIEATNIFLVLWQCTHDTESLGL